MSAGFRSWIGSIIGRFSSTPYVPPLNQAGFDVVDMQSFNVLFDEPLNPMFTDTSAFDLCYDESGFKMLFHEPLNAIFFGAKTK